MSTKRKCSVCKRIIEVKRDVRLVNVRVGGSLPYCGHCFQVTDNSEAPERHAGELNNQ